jgi:hypothetical protein
LESRGVKYELRHYEWGKKLRFGVAHEGNVYLTAGWSPTSTNYAWNDGKTAEVSFAIDEPESDVDVLVAMFAYIVPGKVDRQRVRIWVSDVSLGEMVLTDGQGRGVRATVPRSSLQGGEMVVSFEFPDAVAPNSIGEGRDPRELAIGLWSFEATPVPKR